MELYKGGLKGYWKLRDAHKLGSGGRRATSKLKLCRRRRPIFRWSKAWQRLPGLVPATNLIVRLRDAYVGGCLALSRTSVLDDRHGNAFEAFQKREKEYDERAIVQMYKSLLVEKQRLAAGASSRQESVYS
ncbi:hypothetical protein HPP92_024911 [Vanilla planifolia]|uniref:Uncharacterized protein n=1 Tax=Vanilla planifolia TaxID=51239 RepID=A0A835U951_VANPL|nr:hypothetical protein HPP92_025194 [Vanilla planifolia]KAG0453607.1 hypothetical protein HPP92_024911 [Vanilla planifolia]